MWRQLLKTRTIDITNFFKNFYQAWPQLPWCFAWKYWIRERSIVRCLESNSIILPLLIFYSSTWFLTCDFSPQPGDRILVKAMIKYPPGPLLEERSFLMWSRILRDARSSNGIEYLQGVDGSSVVLHGTEKCKPMTSKLHTIDRGQRQNKSCKFLCHPCTCRTGPVTPITINVCLPIGLDHSRSHKKCMIHGTYTCKGKRHCHS